MLASSAWSRLGTSESSSERAELERGFELIDSGEYFEAHEVLEDLWRAAPTAERDFFQGLVHVAVAWHHAGRGNRPGYERQLAKAARRLAPYAPTHGGVDVEDLLGQIAASSFPPHARVRIKRS